MSITILTRARSGITVGRGSKKVLVRTTARQGVAGPAGEGDKTYAHDQMSPSATWNIVHGLGKYPSVIIVDSSGNIVEGAIQHIDSTTVVVTFTSAFSGKAYLN